MAGFQSVKKYAEAWDAGRSYTTHFRKAPLQSPQLSMWIDFSMFGGGPPANYYASTPLTAATLDGTAGIYHGDDKSPAAKFITGLSFTSASAAMVGRYLLLDYVMFYPFIDCDDTTTQVMTNTTTLPRYTDGVGLMVMPVCVSAGVGSGSFTFEYVNQSGVTKTSPVQNCAQISTPSANIMMAAAGATATSAGIPFCGLADGDSGVRRINSVTFSVANGGLLCLVLVKPLASIEIRETGVTSEATLILQNTRPPRVYDGAYLNFIGECRTGTLSGQTLVGAINLIWDEGT